MKTKLLVSIFFFFFLFLHFIPFIDRASYAKVVFFNYSLILPLLSIILFKYSKPSGIVLVYFFLFLIAIFMFMFGHSGSIGGGIISAIVPILFFKKYRKLEDLVELLYKPVFFYALLLFVGSIYFYFKVHPLLLQNPLLLGNLFYIASINYVPLVICSFSTLFFIVLDAKKRINNQNSFYDSLLFTIITILNIFFSYTYGTRSTILVGFLLLIFKFYKYWKIDLILLIIVVPYFYSYIINEITMFYGADNIVQAATHSVRIESVAAYVRDSVNLNYNYMEYMSTSSIINLIFSIFPLTFLFIINLVSPVLKFKDLKEFYILIIYFSSLFITFYQMDFLSVFALFFVGGYLKMIQSSNNCTEEKNLNKCLLSSS